MRNLPLFILLFLSGSLFGQSVIPQGTPTQKVLNRGGMQLDSAIILPRRDTASPKWINTFTDLFIGKQDTVLYWFDRRDSTIKPFGSGGGTVAVNANHGVMKGAGDTLILGTDGSAANAIIPPVFLTYGGIGSGPWGGLILSDGTAGIGNMVLSPSIDIQAADTPTIGAVAPGDVGIVAKGDISITAKDSTYLKDRYFISNSDSLAIVTAGNLILFRAGNSTGLGQGVQIETNNASRQIIMGSNALGLPFLITDALTNIGLVYSDVDYEDKFNDSTLVHKRYVDGRNILTSGNIQLDRKGVYTFTGSTATWTLPAVSGHTGMRYVVINSGSGNVTLNSNTGGNDINNSGALSNTLNIAPGENYIIYNNSLAYYILN